MKIDRSYKVGIRPAILVSEGALTVLIYNLRNGATPEGIHHLERRSKSPLANPFVMRMEHERDAVCALFHAYLNNKKPKGMVLSIQAHRKLDKLEIELRSKKELELACWCAPKRCHLESVAELLLHRVRDIA